MAKKDPVLVELENRFDFHPATEVTGPAHDAVRADIKRLAVKWFKALPAGRHRAMALTSLQEAMWAANAAIACDQPDASPDARQAPPSPAADAAAPASAAPAAGAGASKKKHTTPRRRVTRTARK